MQLREYQPSDCAQMTELFYQTVHSVNAKDYTKEQLDAWAIGEVDLQAWDKSFRAHKTICGTGLQIDKTEDGCPSSVNFSVSTVSRASGYPLRSYPRRCLPTAQRIAHAGKTQAPADFSGRHSASSAVCATSHTPTALFQCPWNAQLLQRKSPQCGSPSDR